MSLSLHKTGAALCGALMIAATFAAAPGWAAQPRTKDQAIMDKPDWTASWIWAARDKYTGYNDTVEARKAFDLPEPGAATLRITADTGYRVYVNGEWANDGPGRAWPDHYQYDIIDVAPLLKAGKNEIRVIAKFFGIGTFHQIPQEAGLIAQLDVTPKDGGKPVRVATDGTWEVRDAAGWLRAVGKQSVQMGPFEDFDARNAPDGDAGFAPAAVRYAATEGPWKNLEPRDCPLLTRKPFAFKAFHGATVVERSPWQTFVFPTASWIYDGVVWSNNNVAVSGAFATVVDLAQAGELAVNADDNNVVVDGKLAKGGRVTLEPGRHFVLVVLAEYFGHWRHDTELHVKCGVPMTLRNPMNDSADTPWCFAPFEGGKFAVGDTAWKLMAEAERNAVTAKLDGLVKDHTENSGTLEAFKERLGGAAKIVARGEWTESPHFLFESRKPLKDAKAAVENAEAVVKGDGSVTVQPNAEGDVELCYDLGEQNIGYWQFVIDGEAGLTVDLSGVEYITPSGRVQHTERYRNTMRYVCKEGENRFTSLMRRSGRFLFMTLRNQTKPATLREFRIVESTYPVQPIGRFACSDPRLDKIWEISARTLKLCMEDTFTDCPLYEQTHWVGDARNESVFGYTTFGSDDLAKRCVKLTAYSLDHYPITLCQTPSTWEILLPAWSFLWGISVWDNYEYSADRDFLEWAYPYMLKNLRGASQFTDSRGLFSGPFWNMFDWSGIDDGHNTVIHCSMFAVGACDAAIKSAAVLGNGKDLEWLHGYRKQLLDGINALWDDKKGTYPDSVHNDGKISEKTSLHTGFLGLLYDIVPEDRRAKVLDWVMNPPKGVTPVGSPFAILYLFEALEKMGQSDEIIKAIYRDYQPMLDLDATTVWETFARGTTGSKGFPTRSHCHAWSSAPVTYLNRVILGIVPEAAGGAAYRISPRLNDLEWAKGASASIQGPVTVEWKKAGDTLLVDAKAPAGVKLTFARNDSMQGLKVLFNGEAVQ
jgi:hypothetical protein